MRHAGIMPKVQYNEQMRAVRKENFLADYCKHGVIGPASKVAGVSRTTILDWRRDDKEFDTACEDAFQCAVDIAEKELRRRGVEGSEEIVLYKGEVVWRKDPKTGALLLDDDFNPMPMVIQKSHDRLLEVYTRSHRPIYKERHEVAVTGADGAAFPGIVVEYVLPDGKTVADYEQTEAEPTNEPDPFD